MKKIFFLVMMIMLCCPTVFAQNNVQSNDKGTVLWEMRMIPEDSSEEKERNRWTYLLTNDIGEYAYEKSSIKFLKNKEGKRDINLIQVNTKTIFMNEEILKKINDGKLGQKLDKGDSVESCDILMVFDRENKTYSTIAMKVYSKKGKLLQNKKNKKAYVAIPKGTFAEAMFEVVSNYYENNKKKMLLGKSN